jgi:enediyne biosynthesis protein E4
MTFAALANTINLFVTFLKMRNKAFPIHLIVFSPIVVFLFSCRSPKTTNTLFTLEKETGINFTNKVLDGPEENSFFYRNYYNGGGVAIGDINNDGFCDVMLTSNQGENKLYLNKGNLKFEDITSKTGMRQDSMWSTGVVMADINNDGWLDIYVCNSGHMKNKNRRNKLYINNQNLTFTESAAKYGLDIIAYTTQVSFFDYDLDGDLDCFVINNSPMPINNLGYENKRDLPEADWPVADFFKGGGDHLYRNDNNRFIEVTKQTGIHGTLVSFGLGVSVGDINNDGWPDIYVANDSYERDYLYINQKNGTFKDELEECVEQNSFSSMGADLADINNDGYSDIFTTDMLPGDDYRLKTLGAFDNIDLYNTRIKVGLYRQFMKNCLMVNNKNGQFIETANYSGVSATDWSWGALFFDADNDGFNDIYVCNGINHDVTNLDFMDFFADDIVKNMVISGQKQSVDSVLKHIPVFPMPNKAFRNNGNLSFTDAGKSWGFMEPSFSNGAAYGDLDNDGDLDLVVNNENQASFVYRNNSREQTGNSYIGIKLKGKANNGYAIGAKIKVYADSSVLYRELVPSRGFQSSVDYKQVIGLGKREKIDSLEVIWPDRTYSMYKGLAVNKVHELQQPAVPGPLAYGEEKPVQPLLTATDIGLDKHTEDDYIDYYYERNLPELLSKEGPQAGVADVNGDGLEDMYVGGGKGQAGQLYLQTAAGKFIKKEQADFKMYADFEDVAVLFFDADKDGDMDLYVGAGGNNMEKSSREAQHRLYKNDGQGNFKIDVKAFPNNDMNIAVAVSNDYDGDGDEDLYIGSRSVPYSYGVSPQSYVYNNDGQGHFSDVTQKLNPQLATKGMITGACWTDVNGDGQKELVITGEWMAPVIYQYKKKEDKLEELKATGLEGLNGWWQTVKAGDINGDGKMDLVLGNMGENFYLRPGKDNPVKLWLNDFDKSGTMDQLLTRTVDKRDVPVFLKREMTEQFPGLKKENLHHSEYARKSIQELFSKELIKGAKQKEFNYCKSVIAYNDGQGHFRIEALPVWVQLSSVNAVAVTDINGDGKQDLVLGGNRFGFPPQFGRLDGSYGHVLLNEGGDRLNYIGAKASGLNIRGEIRSLQVIKGKERQYLVATVNNEKPVVFTFKK